MQPKAYRSDASYVLFVAVDSEELFVGLAQSLQQLGSFAQTRFQLHDLGLQNLLLLRHPEA